MVGESQGAQLWKQVPGKCLNVKLPVLKTGGKWHFFSWHTFRWVKNGRFFETEIAWKGRILDSSLPHICSQHIYTHLNLFPPGILVFPLSLRYSSSGVGAGQRLRHDRRGAHNRWCRWRRVQCHGGGGTPSDGRGINLQQECGVGGATAQKKTYRWPERKTICQQRPGSTLGPCLSTPPSPKSNIKREPEASERIKRGKIKWNNKRQNKINKIKKGW